MLIMVIITSIAGNLSMSDDGKQKQESTSALVICLLAAIDI